MSLKEKIGYDICKFCTNVTPAFEVRSHITVAFPSTFKFNIVCMVRQVQMLRMVPILCIYVCITIDMMLKFNTNTNDQTKANFKCEQALWFSREP